MGSSRSSSVASVSWPLSLWGAGAVVGALSVLGAPYRPSWGFWLAGLGGALAFAAALAVPPRRGLLFWGLCGFCLVAASALREPQRLPERTRLPVRFAGTVRDGFRAGETGWSTRLALQRLEGARAGRGEITLTVGGSANPTTLPPPGSRVEGAGELVGGQAGPRLWVKSPLLLQASPPGGVDHLRERCRRKLVEAAGFSLPRQRAAALAAALVLGRREGLGEGQVNSFRASGLAHILAVSGLHVGLLAGAFWYALLAFGVSPRGRRLLLLPVVVLFALLAGGNPPVRRATTATVLLLAASSLGRPLELLPTFWGVVGVLVLLEPGLVGEPGFQLSAATALGLVRWVGSWQAKLGGSRLAGAVAVAAVAQLVSSPLLGLHFAAVPPLAMAANLLAVPLAAAMVVVSLGAVALAWASSALAGQLLALLAGLAAGLGWIARWGEGWALPFPRVGSLWQLALVAALLGSLLPWRRASWALGATVALGVGATLFPWLPAPRQASVAMLPVRQGMALLFSGKHGGVLVDTGRGEREAVQLLAARPGGARIAAVVLTHPDADHIGGAAFLLATLRPRALYLPELFWWRPELLPLRWQAQKLGIGVLPLAAGQRLGFGDVSCEVLWPPKHGQLSENDASAVLRCTVSGVRVLVVGDLERGGEEALLASGQALAAAILQVGHHGSRTSSSERFLAAVAPRVALIPTGTAPRFPFPHPEALSRLRRQRVLILAQNAGMEELGILPGGVVRIATTSPVMLRVTP